MKKCSLINASYVNNPINQLLLFPSKMRILLIHNKYQQKGGENVVFEAECELLEKNGHTVEKILFDNRQIKTGMDKFLAGVKSLYNFESADVVESAIISFKPDVIHVHNLFPIASPAIFFVAQKHEVPVVATLHNYRLICPSATLFHNGKIYEKSIYSLFPLDAIYQGVYRNSRIQTASAVLMTGIHKILGTWKNKVDRYIVLTDFAKRKFLNSGLGVAADKMVVKPNFTADPGAGMYPREDYFLFIGRLTEEKGINTVLDCAKLSKANIKIIGDGPLRAEVEKQASLHSNIQYLGFQDKETIIDALKRCKALLFTSLWYEGFPMTILEAFAAGTPVICSKLGGPGEIVENNISGLHYTPGNVQELSQKMQLLSQDRGLVVSLGKGARRVFEQKYAEDINYQMLLNIYLDVVKLKKPYLKELDIY
jgi:glycosyltransferase involved in cell wall biosynthesis